MVVFRVFRLGYVSDRASFTFTKIKAYKKNFEQTNLEYYGFITPRNGIYNFEGVKSLRLCFISTRARFATFCLTFIQNQLKIYRNYCYWMNILWKYEEMKQLHCEQKHTERRGVHIDFD
jgi:hypothetical protein